MKFKDYNFLSEAMNDLLQQGYDTDFSVLKDEECIKCNKTSAQLSPEEFEIEHWYHFDDASDPGSDMLLFVIASKDKNTKGLVTMAYGAYADSNNSKIIEKLRTHLKTP